MAATGGLATAGARGASLGIFGGKLAKTADLAALERAEQMVAQGVDRGAIWNETGWFQGVDGKWRFEIPDDASRPYASVEGMKMNTLMGGADKLRRDYKHPEAYAAYDFPHYYEVGRIPQQYGSHAAPEYSVRDGSLNYAGSIRARGPDDEVLRNTTLHEMQHHVQDVEDFARGSNASYEAAQIAASKEKTLIDAVLAQTPPAVVQRMNRYDELKTQWRGRDDIPPDVAEEVTAIKSDPAVVAAFAQIKEAVAPMRSKGRGGALERGLIPPEEAFAQYRRVAGETEARNVEARSRMTPEQRRASPPWMTQDIPDEDQIIRMSVEGPQASVSKAETPEFKAWFGGSKAVDGNGKPLVLYHGTTNADRILEGGFKKGWTHLTDSKPVADSYQAWKRGDKAGTLEVYTKVENPAYYDAEGKKYTDIANKIYYATDDAERAGHDAMIIKNIRDNSDSSVPTEPHTTYVVFDPTKIRSTDAAFDPAQASSPNILASNPKEAAMAAALMQSEDSDYRTGGRF